jgi:hypothetical protein
MFHNLTLTHMNGGNREYGSAFDSAPLLSPINHGRSTPLALKDGEAAFRTAAV